MRILLAAAAFLLIAGCTVSNYDGARLMKQEGITDYKFDGFSIWGCAKDDKVSLKFSGKKNGVATAGVICGGLIGKNYTIRYQ